MVYEQHPRSAGQSRPQGNQFLGEAPRRRLHAFEDAERFRALPPVVWG